MMKMTNAQLGQSLKTAFGDLTDDGLTDLLTNGGMFELDLQTGQAKFWPGREMEVHPHPKVVLSGSKKSPIARRLQLWVAPTLSENFRLHGQWSRDRVSGMIDALVLDVRAKERVLPEMMKFAQMPAGYVFSMPQEVYDEYLRLGGHPRSARPLTAISAMGVH